MNRSNSAPPGLPRRTLIKGLATSSLLPLLGGNLLGCSDSNDSFAPQPPEDPGVAASFLHGVASGDPLEDRVIIWTRATPEIDGLVRIDWEVATNETFEDIVANGSGTTTADVDYTVKVDVQGLDAGASYCYRFRVQEVFSPVGRTRLPAASGTETVRFALLSCSNYPAGFFNVYREVADRELNAVLHVGDYIYEYDRDGYASDRAEEFGRVSEPDNELIVLDDYRRRYAQYRTDPDLQAAHAAHPFITVWDDHEIANDTWRGGAENHDPETEGDFNDRVAAALQTYYEWMPIRPPVNEQEVIYRQFRYGDLVDLLMLDTRLVGRDLQLSYADYSTDGIIDVDAARAAIADPARQLLGEEQNSWLKDRLTNSTARWQVLGQQVLAGRYALPSPIIESLDPNDPDFEKGTEAVLQSVQARNTPAEERTPEQQALLDSAIPYNLDAWDGYGFNRDDVFNHAASIESRLVVLAGDTHNAWASQLTDSSGKVVGVEFGGASVSSPGLEDFLGDDIALLFEGFIVTLVDDLQYVNLRDRGYVVVSFDEDSATADYLYVSNIDSTEYTLQEDRATSMTANVDDLLLTRL